MNIISSAGFESRKGMNTDENIIDRVVLALHVVKIQPRVCRMIVLVEFENRQ